MKIGFYGSSLCTDLNNNHSIRYGYTSYIQMLIDQLGCDVIHYGYPGCSYSDIILLQFKELLKNPPHIAIFIWPTQDSLFNRRYRSIFYGSIREGSKLHKYDPKLWNAVKEYYNHIYDYEFETFQYKASLESFDKILLDNTKNIRVIHMWEFGAGIKNSADIDISTDKFIYNVEYPIRWSSGYEIRGPLIGLSAAGQYPNRPTLNKVVGNDPRCNHLDGDIKNEMLTNWILEAIIDNDNKICKDVTDEIGLFYTQSLRVASNIG